MKGETDRDLGSLYGELRRLAEHLLRAEPAGQTLQATALVHEAWLRLAGSENAAWADRRHLLNQAALIMRRQLIDRARRRKVLRNVGEDPFDRVDLPVTAEFRIEQIEQLGAALSRLESSQPRWAEVVNLRYFVGLGIEETAELLGLSASTVKADLRFARAWLKTEVS